MQEIATICHEYNLDIDCIPKGVDDYLCFSVAKFVKNLKRNSATDYSADEVQDVSKQRNVCIWKLKFLDSIQFLPSSFATIG